MAPALLKEPMDPFLSISFITLQGAGTTRPLAGFSTVYHVLSNSKGILEIETALEGSRSVHPGQSIGLSTGRGVVTRLRGKDEASFLQVEINTTRTQELRAPYWFDVETQTENGILRLRAPTLNEKGICIERRLQTGAWEGLDEHNSIIYDQTLDGWRRAERFSGEGEYWIFAGHPLQEPVDPFSSLAMSDRMRNRLVIECYKKGILGRLP